MYNLACGSVINFKFSDKEEILLQTFNKKSNLVYFDVFFLTLHHSIELFNLPTLMHSSLLINNMYVTLLSSTCFEH